jgi:hypothetical protein
MSIVEEIIDQFVNEDYEEDTTEEMMQQNDSFEIHDDIPIPQSAGNAGRRARYPLMKMSVGQCFFVTADRSESGKREERTLRQTVSRYHRRTKADGMRWIVARQDDNRLGVWRKS